MSGKSFGTLYFFLMFSTFATTSPPISLLPGAEAGEEVVWGEREREGLPSNLLDINYKIFVYCNVYLVEDGRPTTKGL